MQLAFQLLALGDVAAVEHLADDLLVPVEHARDAQGDPDFLAGVGLLDEEFRGFGGSMLVDAREQGGDFHRAGEEGVDLLAQHVGLGHAERAFGTAVEFQDAVLHVRGEDDVAGVGDDGFEIPGLGFQAFLLERVDLEILEIGSRLLMQPHGQGGEGSTGEIT